MVKQIISKSEYKFKRDDTSNSVHFYTEELDYETFKKLKDEIYANTLELTLGSIEYRCDAKSNAIVCLHDESYDGQAGGNPFGVKIDFVDDEADFRNSILDIVRMHWQYDYTSYDDFEMVQKEVMGKYTDCQLDTIIDESPFLAEYTATSNGKKVGYAIIRTYPKQSKIGTIEAIISKLPKPMWTS